MFKKLNEKNDSGNINFHKITREFQLLNESDKKVRKISYFFPESHLKEVVLLNL